MNQHHGTILTLCLVLALSLGTISNEGLADSGYVTKVNPYGHDFQWNAFSGNYRFLYSHVGDYDLDAEGTQNPMGSFGEHRFQYKAALAWAQLSLSLELDVVSGQIFGDAEDLSSPYRRLDRRDDLYGLGFDSFLVRSAYLQYLTTFGLFQVGQMTSQYGLGILANDGKEDKWSFEVGRFGDVVDRTMMALTPFAPFVDHDSPLGHIALMVAGDLVHKDENAIYADDDMAYQLTGGLYYRHPKFMNGFIFTQRIQEDADGDELEVMAFNLNGKNTFVLSHGEASSQGAAPPPDLTLTLSYELVYLMGHTDRFQQTGSPEGLDISSFGAAGRLGLASASSGLEGMVEIGYASGDDDPYDDESHAFYFDPDYHVGMIFYQEMLPLISARSVEISSDPANLAEVPKGLDMVPTQGRVTNSLYVFPHAKYTYAHGGVFDHALAHLGLLVLTAPAGYSHSYYSFVHGGYGANHLGAATDSSFLGMELLLDIKAVLEPWDNHLALTLGVAQALFIPGSALEDETGAIPDAVWKILAMISLDWQ